MTELTTSEDQPLAVPTVHRNGTAQVILCDGLEQACEALRQAIEACEATAPNGRDYYPQGDAAFALAKSQHTSRLRRLQGVRQELFAVLEAIA